MGNVLKILRRDLARLAHTPPAIVVILALLLLPSLYTWYNVIGFWNPYDNTGNLTVCVVNEDKGGTTELTGDMNVGDKIVEQLHGNDQLHWEFTDYDTAMDTVQSGGAYAAFVIPENFTADLLTITTGSFIEPKIQYFVNEKSGPVSPKITDTGATTLDETINSTFVSTVSDVAVKAIDEAVDESRERASETQSRAAEKISAAATATSDARAVLSRLNEATGAARDKAAEAREALGRASDGIEAADGSLGQMGETASAMQKVLNDFSAFALPAVTEGLSSVSEASQTAASAAGKVTSAVGQAQGGIQAAIAQGNQAVSESRTLADSVRSAAASLPAGSAERRALEDVASALDERASAAEGALSSLSAASERAQETSSALAGAVSALDAAVGGASDSMSEYSTGLFGTTLPAVTSALEALTETTDALDSALDTQRLLVSQTGLVIDQLEGTMETASAAVTDTDKLFAGLESELGLVYNDVLAFGTSDALSDLVGDEGLNADRIASFMASPTEVVTEQLYPLNAYGSAMAPLFMNLTFWIGAFMLLVIMRQEADSAGIPGVTLAQRYWGRFLLFAAMVVIQALVCCAGVVAIGVQAVNAPALFFAAAVTALAYLAIIYSLSVTLQHIGKGICIVLVFAQIPGATGLYPIEMTSSFFQSIYPLFPFTYGIGAMREAICGFYGDQYMTDLLVLALFFALFTAAGILLRPLMANVNYMVARQVRAGGIFNGDDAETPGRPFRISQIMRALSDKTSYASALKRRYVRFSRLYPKLMRWAIILGVAVPVVLAVVFALTPAEKVWLLTAWLLWIVVIFVALVVIESLRYSFKRQLKLESMSDASLIDLYEASEEVARAARSVDSPAAPAATRGESAAAEADDDGEGAADAPGDEGQKEVHHG